MFIEKDYLKLKQSHCTIYEQIIYYMHMFMCSCISDMCVYTIWYQEIEKKFQNSVISAQVFNSVLI